MMFNAIGDLAQSLSMRRQNASAQADIMRLTAELSSGQVSDVSSQLNGSFGQLSDIENRMALNAAQRTASVEASTLAGTMQGSLEMVQNRVTDLAGRALTIGQTDDGTSPKLVAAAARGTLDGVISALNGSVAGRPIFAGNSVVASPLAGADELMAAARSAVSGANDAAGVIAALDTFFDAAGGGFETLIYQGGRNDMAPSRLGGGEEVSLSIRADDPAIRTILKDIVSAALSGDDTLALTGAERVSLMRGSAASMTAGLDGLTGLRANLGFAEERIGQSISRNSAEHTSLKMARGDLLSVDLFETASALEQAQLRLETIYTLTARTSRLNLVNFL